MACRASPAGGASGSVLPSGVSCARPDSAATLPAVPAGLSCRALFVEFSSSACVHLLHVTQAESLVTAARGGDADNQERPTRKPCEEKRQIHALSPERSSKQKRAASP